MMPTNEGHWKRFRRITAVVLASTLICSSFGSLGSSKAAEAKTMEQETVAAQDSRKVDSKTLSETEGTIAESLEAETESAKAAVQSDKAVEETAKQPAEVSTEAAKQSVEAEKETVKQPTTSVKETEETAKQPVTSMEQTEEMTKQSATSVEQTEEVTKQPTTSVEQTKEVTKQPATSVEETKQTESGEEAEEVSESTEETTEPLIPSPVRKPKPSVNQEIAEEKSVKSSLERSRQVQLAVKQRFTAEDNIGEIKECKITEKNEAYFVDVTGTVSKSVPSNQVYLIELGAYEYSIQGKTPIASGTLSGNTVVFQTELGDITGQDSKLYSKFVMAYQKDGRYISISTPHYITNPEEISRYEYQFPAASSKKGLQGSADMVSDSIDLGVPNIALNLQIQDFVSTQGGIPYEYKGKTYYFNAGRVKAYDELLKQYYDNNMVVSMIILLGNAENTKDLLYDSALDTIGYSPSTYAMDTSNKEDAEWIEAIMTFLGERYTRDDGKYGQVVNWIMGNEINTPRYYNWMGPVSFDDYASETARTYRIFTTALKSCYNNVRTYFSMDFYWGSIPNNSDPYGNFSSRLLLDALNANLEAEGDINWNLAYHAYPYPFEDPAFWDDPSSIVNQDEDSRVVTMSNINVLTDYVEENYGSDTRIILSEQGFTSTNSENENLEAEQAAAFAYSYYIAEFQDMIDAFILTRHVDNQIETDQNYYFGLWTNERNNVEKADRKKEIWEVFKYIDTPDTLRYTNPLLKYIDGVSAWDEDETRLKNFSLSKFQKMPEKQTISVYEPSGYKANEMMDMTGWDQECSDSKNKNLYQGYSKNFDTPADFTDKSVFLTRLKILNPSGGKADVKIRMSSGESYYEAEGTYTVAELNSGKLIGIDLSKWMDRNTVTKIQIWVNVEGQIGCSFVLTECTKDQGISEGVPVRPSKPEEPDIEEPSTETPETKPSEPETPETKPSEPEIPETKPSEPEIPETKPSNPGEDIIVPPSEEDNGISGISSSIYQPHVQNIGWMDPVQNGTIAGTTGKSLAMEAMKIQLDGDPSEGGLIYAAHSQNIGWMNPVSAGNLTGTTGKCLRMEAIWMRLTGKAAEEYDIYYRVHSQNYGWLGWAKNGEYAGTAGKGLRMEAIEICLVKKGEAAPGETEKHYIS